MLPFLRPALAQLNTYTPHPGGSSAEQLLDRLDTNENPYDLPADLKQKLAWAYQQEIEANRYPDGSLANLKTAIAAYVNQSAGVDFVTAADLSVGNGSDELIRSLLIATCVGENGSILVAQPTFSMYGILAQTLGIPVVTVQRSSSFELDLAAAQQVIQQATQQTGNPPVRVVFMVHPNSPTANALTAAELEWLRTLPEQILVVIDEAYFEFSRATVLAELQQRPNWVILRTFSKAFRLAAHRVGYAVAHPELAAVLEKVRLPYNLPATTQTAALVALAYRTQLLAVIPTLLAERDQLFQALSQIAELRVYPSDANFLFVLPTSTTAANLFERLKSAGTLVRHTSGGLRISVGTPEENQRTVERLQQILSSQSI
ncbi:MAG: histidinol-phosphate transaminase [Cyanobacteria bacterium RM1_2_2]|nr:histidinol-phosphate transaminase [Cyanobacteria bacterium RM1_2_2]